MSVFTGDDRNTVNSIFTKLGLPNASDDNVRDFFLDATPQQAARFNADLKPGDSTEKIMQSIIAHGGNTGTNGLAKSINRAISDWHDGVVSGNAPPNDRIVTLYGATSGMTSWATYLSPSARPKDAKAYVKDNQAAIDFDRGLVKTAFQQGHTAKEAGMTEEINDFAKLVGPDKIRQGQARIVAENMEGSQLADFMSNLRNYDRDGNPNSAPGAGARGGPPGALKPLEYGQSLASVAILTPGSLRDQNTETALQNAISAGQVRAGTNPDLLGIREAVIGVQDPAQLKQFADLHSRAPCDPAVKAPDPANVKTPQGPANAATPAQEGEVNFALGSSTLDDAAKKTIATEAQKIKSLGRGAHASLRLTGMADATGSETFNEKLAKDRATAYEGELTKDLKADGVDPTSVKVTKDFQTKSKRAAGVTMKVGGS